MRGRYRRGPLTKVRVYKWPFQPWGDWIADCPVHRWEVTCPDQEMAYEAAMGHICMHHPRSE